MPHHIAFARALILPYLNQTIPVALDGTLFARGPGIFLLHFSEPARMQARLAAIFTNELTHDLPCLHEEVWVNDALVPIASVRTLGTSETFAYVLLDWRNTQGRPSLLFPLWNDWSNRRSLPALELLTRPGPIGSLTASMRSPLPRHRRPPLNAQSGVNLMSSPTGIRRGTRVARRLPPLLFRRDSRRDVGGTGRDTRE